MLRGEHWITDASGRIECAGLSDRIIGREAAMTNLAFRLSIALLLVASSCISQEVAASKDSMGAGSGLSNGGEQPDLSVETSLVNVHALVTDEDGRVLAALKKENFRVLDEGIPQTIKHFEPSTAPITIVMLIEYSAAAYNYFAYKAASWAAGFTDHLEPKDWVALVTYDIRSTVRMDFTRNRADLRQSLNSLGFPTFRDTNLFDAVLDTLDKLDRVKGRKSILLLTSGANSMSAATFDDVVKRLRGSDVTIFSVGLAEEEYVRSAGSDIGYLQARSQLNTFAELTGGMAFFPRFQAELPELFRSITGFLRSEYTLSFTPENAVRDGKYHRLSVEVVDRDGKPLTVVNEKGRRRKVTVIARAGYVAPGPRAERDGTDGARKSPRDADR
jgi:VWFA-related protein